MRLPRCETRLMIYFQAVATTLNFRKAAEDLNIAQPALSRAIVKLEEILQTKLLARDKRSVALTDAGHTFLKGCNQVTACLENAISDTWKVRDGMKGRLSIGYTDFAITGSLPSLISDFRQLYPEISISLEDTETAKQLDAVDDGSLQLGMATGPIFEPKLEQLTLQNDLLMVVLPETHPLAGLDAIPLTKLAELPFVAGRRGIWDHYLRHMEAICELAGFHPNIVQEAADSDGIFGLIAAGVGITIHPETALNYYRRGLSVRPIADVNYRVPTLAVWRKENPTLATQHFVNFLRENQIADPS